MSSQDNPAFVDQDRVGEPELLDTLGDLADLSL
jgi:hypothetical protein